VRIVSLLPSATEIACLLGLESSLVGVTHECDWPPAVKAKRQVTKSLLPKGASPAEVDHLVSAATKAGAPTYWLDRQAIGRPELVRAQRFFAANAGAFFSRPGPRLVDGVEALAEAFHGSGEAPGALARLRCKPAALRHAFLADDALRLGGP
jgi:ABC-type Fe3+-hydroxamate transport system substrate-binding protein